MRVINCANMTEPYSRDTLFAISGKKWTQGTKFHAKSTLNFHCLLSNQKHGEILVTPLWRHLLLSNFNFSPDQGRFSFQKFWNGNRWYGNFQMQTIHPKILEIPGMEWKFLGWKFRKFTLTTPLFRLSFTLNVIFQ